MTPRAHVNVPREAWLRSRDNDVYAAALSECRSGDPSWCSAHEKCRNGDCFIDSHIVAQRAELRHLVVELGKIGRELRRKFDEKPPDPPATTPRRRLTVVR